MNHRTRTRAIARQMDRRDFLRRAGLITGGVVLAPSVLAACGGDGDTDASSSTTGGGPSGAKEVRISNWTSYISEDSKADFEKATGLKLVYSEDINDNNEYFAKIRPNLSDGKGIDRDGIVLTDWMCNRLINQLDPPWVQPLDVKAFTNKKNLRAALRSPAFDAERTFSAPWQSGVGGFAYNIGQTGKEIRTLDDFLALDGTKTVLSEMRDTLGIFMMAAGKDITEPSLAEAADSFDALQAAVDDGSISGFNGNEYVNDLAAGNLIACFAWSGDIAQIALDNPDIRFAVPESGGTLWSDNFMIPIGTDRVDVATEFINFFYDPVNAAKLTAYVQYISPVDGVADELTKLGGDAAKLVENPLVVPTDEFLAGLQIFGPIAEDEEEEFDQRFAEILGAG